MGGAVGLRPWQGGRRTGHGHGAARCGGRVVRAVRGAHDGSLGGSPFRWRCADPGPCPVGRHGGGGCRLGNGDAPLLRCPALAPGSSSGGSCSREPRAALVDPRGGLPAAGGLRGAGRARPLLRRPRRGDECGAGGAEAPPRLRDLSPAGGGDDSDAEPLWLGSSPTKLLRGRSDPRRTRGSPTSSGGGVGSR